MDGNQNRIAVGKVLENGDRIEIRFIPLPPEKRQAWNRSMRLITDLLLEIVHENPKGDCPRDVE